MSVTVISVFVELGVSYFVSFCSVTGWTVVVPQSPRRGRVPSVFTYSVGSFDTKRVSINDGIPVF